MMKDDEIRFFRTCWQYRHQGISIRDIICLVHEFIHYKRCYYLLDKWARLDFYDYGVALDLGWFEPDALPERYRVLLDGE